MRWAILLRAVAIVMVCLFVSILDAAFQLIGDLDRLLRHGCAGSSSRAE